MIITPLHHEGGSASGRVPYTQDRSVQGGNLTGNGQAKAEMRFVGPTAVSSGKPIKDTVFFCVGDPGAVIHYCDAIHVASIVILWKVLFAKNGLVNGLICSLGGHAVDFMGTEAAFWVLVFTYVWKNAGYDMILWLAGLDGISADLYEAASVDGANAWQKFFYITLPNLLPTLTLVSVLSLLNSFKAFREAFLVGGNYPHESMYLLQHLFNNWFLSLDLPRLTAAAVLMALALSGLILALQRIWTRDK